ncbi:MAG: hypothetical protein DRJ11_11110 [Candidatus Aminicenantes bacterium]|nr:MAG: hypothetical protein DRJ11_11110 [Candidatus Aminicenantes bacterium]
MTTMNDIKTSLNSSPFSDSAESPSPSRKQFPPGLTLLELGAVLLVGGGFLLSGTKTQNPLLILMSIISAWVLINFFLRARGSSWREFGLGRPPNWWATVGLALAGTVALHLVVSFIFKPWVTAWLGSEPDISRFDPVRGNLPAFLFSLAVVWTTAAFGEEMIFRGFFLNRLAQLGRQRVFSWIIALLFSSVIFGLGHAYQGVAGVVLTALAGLFFGLIYLACRHNLWVPILVHGLYDTTAFLILFLNLDH